LLKSGFNLDGQKSNKLGVLRNRIINISTEFLSIGGQIELEMGKQLPLNWVCCKELAVTADSAGTLQVESQDVGFERRWKTKILESISDWHKRR
jgi:hypothetical protein